MALENKIPYSDPLLDDDKVHISRTWFSYFQSWANQIIAGVVQSITGTAGRILVTGTPVNPIVNIDPAYVGQTSITTLGAVTEGVWNATPIAVNKGGTGQTSYLLGDTLYASGSAALSKLPGVVATSRHFLSQTGTGAVSAPPSWTPPVSALASIPGRMVRGTTTGDIAAVGGQIILQDGDSLSALVAAVGSTPVQVTVCGQMDITANLTIPATMAISAPKCALPNFAISTGVTLTMPIPQAGNFQIFTGAGTVEFNPNGTVRPQWWGIVAGSDCSAAFSKAVVASESVYASSGTYTFTGDIDLPLFSSPDRQIRIYGDGPLATFFDVHNLNSTLFTFTHGLTGPRRFYLENLNVNGQDESGSNSTVWPGLLKGANLFRGVRISKCIIGGTDLNASKLLDLTHAFDIELDDVKLTKAEDGYALYSDVSGFGTSTTFLFKKVYMDLCRQIYWFDSVKGVTFDSCIFESSAVAGASLLTNITFMEPHFEDIGYPTGVKGLTIKNMGVHSGILTDEVNCAITDMYGNLEFYGGMFEPLHGTVGTAAPTTGTLAGYFQGIGRSSSVAVGGSMTFSSPRSTFRNKADGTSPVFNEEERSTYAYHVDDRTATGTNYYRLVWEALELRKVTYGFCVLNGYYGDIVGGKITIGYRANSPFTDAPIDGTWEVGDKVLFSSPIQGGSIGKVCVTAGTPGTWAPFGYVGNQLVVSTNSQAALGASHLLQLSRNGSVIASMSTYNDTVNERPIYRTRRARGSLASPTAPQSLSLLASHQYEGYAGSTNGFQLAASIDVTADENWVDGSAYGSRMGLRITRKGEISPFTVLDLKEEGVESAANLKITLLGAGLQVKAGTNGRINLGNVLVAGTVVVANTSVTANTVFSPCVSTVGGTQGILSFVRNPGVGYTINSTNAADTSTVDVILTEAT